MKTISSLTILLMLSLLLAACGGSSSPAQPTNLPAADTPVPAVDTPAATGEVSFAADVLPILESRCIACHGSGRVSGGVDLTTYANLTASGVVTPGDSASSSLAQTVLSGDMPRSGPKLTASQTQLIVDWINQGGLDN